MSSLDKPDSSARCKLLAILCCLLMNCQAVDAQRSPFDFDRLVIDSDFEGGYGVELADIDGDSLLDVVALSTNPAQFIWYRNPDWQKYTIASTTQGNIDSAASDIDGDGDIDLVLASDFSLSESSSGGLMQWFENPGNPAETDQWAMHYIDQIPTTHRIAWGDINGDGEDELLSLPIIGVGATAPDYDESLELRAYAVPRNLAVRRWPSVVLDRSLQMSHGMTIVDWDYDGREDILTASFYGVHLFQLASRGQAVAKQYIAMGNQEGERPAIGSSEVGVGVLAPVTGRSGDTRFVATLEPWHGNEVAVYRPGSNRDALWTRQLIADDYAGGHALVVADLDNDGGDEIIVGGRSEPFRLGVHRFDSATQSWTMSKLDTGSIAVSGLALGDLNGDGYNDIVAIGGSTGNVVYFMSKND